MKKEGVTMFRRMLIAAAAAFGLVQPAAAQDRVALVLNWTPGADHAPLYWAQAQGQFREAGIALTIENGRGSGFAAQRVGAGQAQIGIVDTPVAFQARAQGADLTAAMMIYVQSPYGIYWRRSAGIAGPQDFRGRRIGTPPADAARVMWPMIARAMGIPADGVTWVNIAPPAKVTSLQSGAIDITTEFFTSHHVYQRALGDDLGFLATRDVGFNPYGNAFFFNAPWLRANPDAARRLTRVIQRAYAACLANPDPCLAATTQAAAMSMEDIRTSWGLVAVLMTSDAGSTLPLGGMDQRRMADTIEAVRTAFNIPAVTPAEVMTNDLLDPAVPAFRGAAR
jgi:NitT/TauT family transport system substrate-binding protein